MPFKFQFHADNPPNSPLLLDTIFLAPDFLLVSILILLQRDDEESFEEDDDEDDDEIYQNLSDMLDAPPKKKKEKEGKLVSLQTCTYCALVSARELEKHSKLLEKLGQDIERPVKKQKVVLTETVAEGEFSRTSKDLRFI